MTTTTTRTETRAVLAATYVKIETPRTHAVAVDAKGAIVKVLCSRVKIASLCDSGATDPHAAPTCLRCLAALARKPRRPVNYCAWCGTELAETLAQGWE